MAETLTPDETDVATGPAAFFQEAASRGLLDTKDRQLGGRFARALVERAKEVSGIKTDTELMTYALLKVALEDDFGAKLISRRGSVPKDTLFAG